MRRLVRKVMRLCGYEPSPSLRLQKLGAACVAAVERELSKAGRS